MSDLTRLLEELHTLETSCDEAARLFRQAALDSQSHMASQQETWAQLARDVSLHLQQLETEKAELQYGASERDAIASLVSDREEAGTYPKVEGLLNQVEQLEQEKATLLTAQNILEMEKADCGLSWEDERAARTQAEDERDQARAALAETRDALHQLTEKYDELEKAARGDGR